MPSVSIFAAFRVQIYKKFCKVIAFYPKKAKRPGEDAPFRHLRPAKEEDFLFEFTTKNPFAQTFYAGL